MIHSERNMGDKIYEEYGHNSAILPEAVGLDLELSLSTKLYRDNYNQKRRLKSEVHPAVPSKLLSLLPLSSSSSSALSSIQRNMVNVIDDRRRRVDHYLLKRRELHHQLGIKLSPVSTKNQPILIEFDKEDNTNNVVEATSPHWRYCTQQSTWNPSSKTSVREGSDQESSDAVDHVLLGARSGERKKLKLTEEQSFVLERTFMKHSTVDNKKKFALAEQLNLKPRQIEVWFQNRRARTKLKRTEIHYEYLKRYSEKLTIENQNLKKEIQQLRRAVKFTASEQACQPSSTSFSFLSSSCDRHLLSSSSDLAASLTH